MERGCAEVTAEQIKGFKMKQVTCTAPVNIAVIKYWGKRNEELILPINSSLSVTLHQDQLKTTTTVAASRDFTEDRIWLNGKEDQINQPRLQSCLREIRRLARKRRSSGEDSVSRILNYKVHICSVNNFPTAAGLASSAAGYACLVYTLAKLYGVEGELSEIARQGSGSACRSMHGGFVQWVMGEREDGKDSLAQQVEPETHWPELRILILVASAEKKHVGSTAGMQTSVETSPLLKLRAESVVPGRMGEMIEAIKNKDFEAFGQLTMKDSNQFHATCLDTFPPIFYLNQVSQRIISLVHRYNNHYGQTKVAYSFDAGPNAVIFALEPTVNEFVEIVKRSFPPEPNGDPYLKGLQVSPAPLSQELLSAVETDVFPGGVHYVIVTQPGPGPVESQDPSLDLLGPDGLPKTSA
ncbi:diphosphomevalonate decarboxylase isoform X1 [Bufo gargarizans]|uniref:diphosphomevalonate decarboxylase isoform X1 n=2 Tax=Bufo gargarizans TaxID=30331 RepID=UPI001CF55B66|nr:diphosphomevalonate decarboxylase isoform X1 [Bufo gargarizans]